MTEQPNIVERAYAQEQATYTPPANAEVRAALEADLQRLDGEIATHLTRTLTMIGTPCEVSDMTVFTWRHRDSEQYVWWRNDYFAACYWRARDEAAWAAREGRRLALMESLTLMGIGALGTLIAGGIVAAIARAAGAL